MRTFTLLLFCCLTATAFGQDSTQTLKSRYYSDEIAVGVFDKTLSDSLEYANKLHPAQLYTICGSFYRDSMLNEAAVVYLIARNRYRLYNKTNPNYEASADGALAGSFSSIFGSVVTPHLQENLENFAHVLKFSGTWYKENKYFYFDYPENDSLYQLQTDAMLELSDTLLNHPEEYIQQLENKRKEREELMKKYEEELDDEFEDMPSED
ncbi:MAG: hypothetical protein HWE22_01890 [Flavobacteriales bacterium]|nr:hypothetical protein [Flavobacteriales bacterium]